MTHCETLEDQARDVPILVALCASAASTRVLEHLMVEVPLQDDAAIIAVLQHREALDEDRLAGILRDAGRSLTQIEDGMRIEPAHIYLAAADFIVGLNANCFRVRPVAQAMGERGTIDSFLVSLAAQDSARNIAVVLAGTGSDGTLGLKAIKQSGGLTLAEETEESRHGELTASNTPAALADAVLPVDALVPRIDAYLDRLAAVRDLPAVQLAPAETTDAIADIATILRNRTGHDFHGYKAGTFLRRIQRRMQVVQVEEVGHYIEVLREQPEEALQLFNDLLIGVTQFFRDAREFDLLEREVIPKIFAGKTRADQVRVWVIGCSTGEEAYSIGILLREYHSGLADVPQVQIFATDLDGRALAAARAGRYALSIADAVTPERLARWFVREGNTYCVVKALREMCIFSQHNIVKDAPFSRLDLVSCRNLLIYLDTELQSRIIPLFHFALRPSGFLFLGNSENTSRHAKLFAPIESRSRIFRRLDTVGRVLTDFPFTAVDRRLVQRDVVTRRSHTMETSLARRAERLAERHAPAYVIVDSDYDVLHFSGRTGRYIDPSGGAASLNLLQLVHLDLRPGLRAALSQATEEGRVVQVENLQLGQNGHRLSVDLVIEPVHDGFETAPSFVVLFKDGGTAQETASGGMTAPAGQSEHTQWLEAELRTTKDRLHSTIEELESTNEELKASNEEYQSLNEELQSANEELETSKEELQSINEELVTVNGELGHRVQELGRANSDLKNFLESTQIATVFLDDGLRITNFTPTLAEIFHLLDTDAGRPIYHIKSRITYEELQDDARRVMRTLSAVEREITSATGTRYLVRVLPYRSVANVIAGVVVTFVDITARKLAEERREESERRMRALVEGIPQLVWRAADKGQWTWASSQWCTYTGLSEERSQKLGWLAAVHPDDRERVHQAWGEAESTGSLDLEYRVCHVAERAYRWFAARATALRDENGAILEWLGTLTDIDDLRRLQESQTVMVSELQHRTRNLIGVIRSIMNQTMRESSSLPAFETSFNHRLAALARVQGLLSRADSEPITIRALIRSELNALGMEEACERITLDGPDVALRKGSVQTLALALHELATNALKYGALKEEAGRLTVTWQIYGVENDGRRLTVEWLEVGIDRQREERSSVTRHGGYGRELIERALPYALQARTTYELNDVGVRCTIDLPLDYRPG